MAHDGLVIFQLTRVPARATPRRWLMTVATLMPLVRSAAFPGAHREFFFEQQLRLSRLGAEKKRRLGDRPADEGAEADDPGDNP